MIYPASNNSSVAFCGTQSQLPSTESSVLQSLASVNQMEKDIKKMEIKDPADRSSVSHTQNDGVKAEPRQTNQDSCPYRGLLNLGATCYLNSTVQVLFMTRAFRERVLQRTPGDTSEKLETALKELFEELCDQDKGALSVSTKRVIKALGVQRLYEQQDAVEYFLDILEKVGPDLAEVFSGTMRNKRKCSEDHESHDDSSFKSLQIALNITDGAYKIVREHQSPSVFVLVIVRYKLPNALIMLRKGAGTAFQNYVACVQVIINGFIWIFFQEDGVRSYFESTTLVGDDQMYCETCDEKRDTTWGCEIHKYPAILSLHLKRFVYNYWLCGFEKNDCPMDVPLHLSLGEHRYGLYAVINHRGSRYGGHYTADIRSFTDNRWYCFDDSHVTEIHERKLERSREAYLLLYQKPSSVARVEDKEEPKTKIAEAGEPVETGRAGQCGAAHNKPHLEVSAVTGRLRILVLGRPEIIKTILEERIVRDARFSLETQPQRDDTIRDSLEMCSPGHHMVLWVTQLGNNKEDFEAFEEIYRPFAAREYIMIVFTSAGRPTESHIENAMQCYAGINNHVLDIGVNLHDQVEELISKMIKIVGQNENRGRLCDDAKKPQKRKHGKTESMHKKEKASKRNVKSNHEETDERDRHQKQNVLGLSA
ncbi:ubiquitin carboxyl-terminal hydrolase 40-like [Carassius carassius]|uniref:ubiquitin carboxyl-terminal hydrolase 40-like n=1 Tax=Carassius carassius TaxID=217509 RepID=UPI002868CE1C|nr:ubiquitin carboxyl-terminal hydrolase 40-like [Carassius carassius]